MGRRATLDREIILERAADIVLASGITEISIDTLCQQLSMSKKTLYKFFPTKENLQQTIISWFYTHLEEELVRQVASSRGVPADKRFQEFFSYLSTRLSRLDISKFHHLEHQRPDLWSLIVTLRERIITRCISEIVAEGCTDGTFRADLRPELITQSLITLLTYISTPERLIQLQMTPSQCIGSLSSLILHGLIRRLS